jgi:hypothetical protein
VVQENSHALTKASSPLIRYRWASEKADKAWLGEVKRVRYNHIIALTALFALATCGGALAQGHWELETDVVGGLGTVHVTANVDESGGLYTYLSV